MTPRWLGILLFASTLGSGLVAGGFLAFSSFIMSALGKVSPASGIAAMQSINVSIIGSSWLLMLVATTLASLVLSIRGFAGIGEPGSIAMIVGGVVYLLGVVVVTAVFNIPRNDALAALDPTSSAAPALWASYRESWTLANHVRALASLGSTVAFLFALVRRGG